MHTFTQKDYGVLVEALDQCMKVFLADGRNEERAQDALKDFVTNHFCTVWRSMIPVRSPHHGGI